MENVIGTLALVLIIGLLVVLVRRIRTTRRVDVWEDVTVGGRPEAHETALIAAVSYIRGTQLQSLGPGRYVVVFRRVPTWAVIPVFVLFPVGLVFLTVRERIRLDLALLDGPDGAMVRLHGQSESHILSRLRTALRGLGPLEPATPSVPAANWARADTRRI